MKSLVSDKLCNVMLRIQENVKMHQIWRIGTYYFILLVLLKLLFIVTVDAIAPVGANLEGGVRYAHRINKRLSGMC